MFILNVLRDHYDHDIHEHSVYVNRF